MSTAVRRPVLVLAEPDDIGAAAVARALAARWGSGAVRFVSEHELVIPQRISSAIVAQARAGGRIEPAAGVALRGDGVACVLNRLQSDVPPRFARAGRYAHAAEVRGLVVQWLATLPCPVVNPVDEYPEAGDRSFALWRALGAGCGLALAADPASASSPLRDVVVVGERVLGVADELLARRCVRVAVESGCPLLGLRFAAENGHWALCDVDPLPELREPAEVDAVAELLERLGQLHRRTVTDTPS